MKIIVLSILYIFSLPCFAEDINKDVLSIINSVQKNAEKPRIEQDECCSACPEKNGKGEGEGCNKDVPLDSLEEKASKKDNMLLLMEGKKYEVLKDPKKRKAYLIHKQTSKQYFSIKDGTKEFVGLKKDKSENFDKKFLREYKQLESVYGDIKFRELCEYLTDNRQRYSELRNGIRSKKFSKKKK